MLGVVGDGAPGQLQDVGRVVAHQVVEAAVVPAAVRGVELSERVEEGAGLAAVADPELHDVQLLRQRTPFTEGVPHGEQLADHRAHRLVFAGVALAARERGLVAVAGGLLPGPKVLPVEGVEPPDEAAAGRPPLLERAVSGRCAAGAVGAQGGGHRARRGVGVACTSEVNGQLQRVAAGAGHQHDRRAEALAVLDPVRGDPQSGQGDVRIGDHRIEGGTERGDEVDGVLATQPGGGADFDVHLAPDRRGSLVGR